MRKITEVATPTAVPKEEQQSVTHFLTLENVLGSKIYERMCTAHRVLSQNQLWTDGYKDSRWDKQVWVKNLKAVDR